MVPGGDTGVQFHSDQVHLLVFHETQIPVYDVFKMDCVGQVKIYS